MERTSRVDSKRNLIFTIGVAVIVLIYLTLRLSFPETIEFAYDQPKTANLVIDFVQNGTYLNSQNYTQETIGGVVAWGPSLLYIFAPFFLISNDPILVSQLISIFNSLSVVMVILIGYLFFNKRVAIISGLIMASLPIWFVFSRMIYQPSLIPTIISLSLLFLFLSINKLNGIWTSLLFLSWGILIQMYLVTYPFIVISFFAFAYSTIKNKIPYREILTGLLFNLIIFIPSIIFYIQRPELIGLFLNAKKIQVVSISEIVENFINVLSGGGLKWQLGYAYQEFLNQFKIHEFYYYIVSILIFIPIAYVLIESLRNKNKRNMILLLLTTTSLWALPLVGIEFMVPRYFLYVLPPFALLLGISFDLFLKKIGNIYYIALGLILFFWIYEIYSYNIFIKNFNYYNGVLSSFSDVPYFFTTQSFDWIKEDSIEKGCKGYKIFNELNLAQSYYVNNNVIDDEADCLYNMEYKNNTNIGDIQIGPYVIRRISKSDPAKFINP